MRPFLSEQGAVQTRGRDVLDRQLLAAGASKTEHVVHLTLNPAQTFLYQALLKVRGRVDALSLVLYQSVLDAAIMPPALPRSSLANCCRRSASTVGACLRSLGCWVR